MLYVIIFVLLLAVLIFFKQKEKAAKQDKSSSSKRPTSTAKRSTAKAKVRQTVATEEPAAPVTVQQPTSTPVDEKTKATIQQHMATENYSVAEAYINQCLNKDPSQHELYLELLSVHLAQKDDFSAQKLLEQLQQKGLLDTYEQAQIKYKATKYVENPQGLVEYEQTDFTAFVEPSVKPEPDPQQSESLKAFDDLNQTEWTSPNKAVAAEEEKVLTDLEFAPAKVDAVPEESKVVDFNFSLDTPAPEAKPEVSASEQAPLEFNFTNTQEPSSSEQAPLEFDLSTTPATQAPTEKKEEIEPLNFDFSNLEVAQPASVTTEATPSTSADVLDFGLDLPSESTPITTQPTDAQLSPATAEISKIEMDENDPIVISFPHLREVHEADLNLELAEQYIQLGSYQAARELLEQSHGLNATQQAKLASLQQQLAS